jgi:hypothetical protein
VNGWLALGLVWVSTAFGGIVGTLVGWLIGTKAPNYYVTVFDAVGEAGFNPVEVGIGLGATQGMLAGFLAGISIRRPLLLARCESGLGQGEPELTATQQLHGRF